VGRPRPWPHCFRWGPSYPSPKRYSPQIFRPYVLWPNGWMDQDVTWCGARLRPRRLCVKWGPRFPSPKGGQSPPPKKKSAHVYCDQTAVWMKVVLGMEVGLSPGDFVLDGDPVPFPQKGAEPPYQIFGPFLLWPNGSMHQNATWYGCWPQPRGLCVLWRPSPPSRTKGRRSHCIRRVPSVPRKAHSIPLI